MRVERREQAIEDDYKQASNAAELAQRYGVNTGTIVLAAKGATWEYVE